MTPDPEDSGDLLEAPQRALVGNGGAPVLRLDGYEGPLDLLLELARAQRVDPARRSRRRPMSDSYRCSGWASG